MVTVLLNLFAQQIKPSLDTSCYLPPFKPTSPFLISVPHFFSLLLHFLLLFFTLSSLALIPLFSVRLSLSEMLPVHKSILDCFTQKESFVEMLLFLNNLFLRALFPFGRISFFFFFNFVSQDHFVCYMGLVF